jgi:hypothetical protein
MSSLGLGGDFPGIPVLLIFAPFLGPLSTAVSLRMQMEW